MDGNANIYHQHYILDDNPYLSPFFVEQLKKEYSGVYYQRYILGLWTKAEGLIYDMFDPEYHVVETVDRDYEEYYISIDYGTQNATVFLLHGRYKNKWYVVKEYYYSGRDTGRQKTDSEFADEMDKFVEYIYSVPLIIVDPSAASLKAELRKRGYLVRDAKNDVVNGIRYTQNLLNLGKILINDICKKTIEEIHSYSWDEKASEKGEDVPIKENDHAMDALRYFVYTILRRYYKGQVIN